MNEARPNNIWEAMLDDIRQIVRDEIRACLKNTAANEDSNPVAPYLTVKQVAEISSLAPSTIRILIRRGVLRANHVGRRVVIKRKDLEQFLESRPMKTVDRSS